MVDDHALQAFEQELSDEEAVDHDDQADKHTVDVVIPRRF